MKIFILLSRRSRLLFNINEREISFPKIEIKNNEKILLKVKEFMKNNYSINVQFILDKPWCFALFKNQSKKLNFIPDFPYEIKNCNFLCIPVSSIDEIKSKNLIWLLLTEIKNYKIDKETEIVINEMIKKNLLQKEKVPIDFCG